MWDIFFQCSKPTTLSLTPIVRSLLHPRFRFFHLLHTFNFKILITVTCDENKLPSAATAGYSSESISRRSVQVLILWNSLNVAAFTVFFLLLAKFYVLIFCARCKWTKAKKISVCFGGEGGAGGVGNECIGKWTGKCDRFFLWLVTILFLEFSENTKYTK